MISYTLHIEIGGHVTAYWQTEKTHKDFQGPGTKHASFKKTYKTNPDKKQ
jgi:hypothetical protein